MMWTDCKYVVVLAVVAGADLPLGNVCPAGGACLSMGMGQGLCRGVVKYH